MDTPKKLSFGDILVLVALVLIIITALIGRAPKRTGDGGASKPINPIAEVIADCLGMERGVPGPGKFDWDKLRERNKDKER